MNASRVEGIVQRLQALRSLTPELQAAAIISVEGLMIASSLPEELAEERLAAMSAAMLALGERIAGDLGRGNLEQVFIKGEQGYALLTTVNEESGPDRLGKRRGKTGFGFPRYATGGR